MLLNKLINTKGAHYPQNMYYQRETDCVFIAVSFANTSVEQANYSEPEDTAQV